MKCFVPFLVLITVLQLGCANNGIKPEHIEKNNLGVGLMGHFQYQDAEKVFAELSAALPQWQAVRVNLAIATLNLQQPGGEDLALEMLAEVLRAEPNNLRAAYCSGLLHVYKGNDEVARPFFEQVVAADPADPHAAYYLGQCHARAGDYPTAISWYQKATEADPYLSSAYYGLFQAWQRQGDRVKAREMLTSFQKLKDNPQVRQVEFKYTRMGAKAEAAVFDLPGAKKPAAPSGPLFADRTSLAPLPDGISTNPAGTQSGITVCDLNGDQLPDIFIPSALKRGDGVMNGIFLSSATGYQVDLDHPLAAIEGINTVLWGDYDNDGFTDAYLCRKGQDMLWRQSEANSWQDVTATSDLATASLNTVDGSWVDADHDGDLDLFLAHEDGPVALFNNNLDGSFRPLAGEWGLSGSAQGARSVVIADLDHDRDVDLMVINRQPPHDVFVNDRLWNYSPGQGFDQLRNQDLAAVLAADTDADGQVELYAASPDGKLNLWRRDTSGRWSASQLAEDMASPRMAWADLDGSGQPGVVYRSATDLVMLRPGANGGERLSHNLGAGSGPWATVMTTPANGASLLTVANDGSAGLWSPGPGRFPFAALSFSGKISSDQATRSNASGLGTVFAARAGSRWSAGNTLRNHSGPGNSLQPRAVGLGDSSRLDFVALTWSDGVFQTELNLEGGKAHQIVETQRQLASCPVLFAWDGKQYRFISDILGVAGMGFNLGRGEYAPPRPRESFMLPPGFPKAHDNLLRLKIGEPMEESSYLDHVNLVAYDLPEGWQMVLDERMGVSGPEPTGRPIFYRQEMVPVSAVNERGEDVLAAVLTADLKAAPTPPIDKRFLGLLTAEHVLDLGFDKALESGEDKPVLRIDGWLEYPYSQTCFAAWQAGLAYEAPTLETRTADGDWQVYLEQWGYPAGMPRTMALPLHDLPKDTVALRLRTNQEIYWDRISVVFEESNPGIQRTVQPLQRAMLNEEGFAKRTTLAQAVPHYDDTTRVPLWDTRHQAGFHTALGEITPLLTEADDALAIYGPGEAVALDFQQTQQQADTQRIYVLESLGWCKDMDLYTQHGETIEPLPQLGPETEKRAELHKRYLTRYRSGY